MTTINTGINQETREAMAQELSKILASNYTLYLKTQNFHWNVTGPFFQILHTMFEVQYTELAIANDEIAERIRALGIFAPGTYTEFSKLTFVEEPKGRLKAKDMVQTLLEDHEKMIQAIRIALEKAGEQGDEATADILSPRLSTHEKTAWMLRSFLEE
jgi:starvation-inducible DNA-binding protein